YTRPPRPSPDRPARNPLPCPISSGGAAAERCRAAGRTRSVPAPAVRSTVLVLEVPETRHDEAQQAPVVREAAVLESRRGPRQLPAGLRLSLLEDRRARGGDLLRERLEVPHTEAVQRHDALPPRHAHAFAGRSRASAAAFFSDSRMRSRRS